MARAETKVRVTLAPEIYDADGNKLALRSRYVRHFTVVYDLENLPTWVPRAVAAAYLDMDPSVFDDYVANAANGDILRAARMFRRKRGGRGIRKFRSSVLEQHAEAQR